MHPTNIVTRSPQYGAGVKGDLQTNIAPLHMTVDQQLTQAVKQAQDEHPDFNPKEWEVSICWFLHRKGDSPY